MASRIHEHWFTDNEACEEWLKLCGFIGVAGKVYTKSNRPPLDDAHYGEVVNQESAEHNQDGLTCLLRWKDTCENAVRTATVWILRGWVGFDDSNLEKLETKTLVRFKELYDLYVKQLIKEA